MLTEEEIVTVHKGMQMKIAQLTTLLFWYISYSQEVKNVSCGNRLPGFKTQLYHLLVL